MGPVGGKGSCEQALARRLFPRLEQDWLLIADRGFYNWADWQAAAATGAAHIALSRTAMVETRRKFDRDFREGAVS